MRGAVAEPPPSPRRRAVPSIELGATQSAKVAGRAALLPVRLEDAAGGLVLRLRHLRQHQRLLVDSRRVTAANRRARLLGSAPRPAGDAAGRGGGRRSFYGAILGLTQVAKPPELAPRGGVWFRDGELEVHLGVEEPFTPGRKAHPAFLVQRPRDAPRADRGSRATG